MLPNGKTDKVFPSQGRRAENCCFKKEGRRRPPSEAGISNTCFPPLKLGRTGGPPGPPPPAPPRGRRFPPGLVGPPPIDVRCPSPRARGPSSPLSPCNIRPQRGFLVQTRVGPPGRSEPHQPGPPPALPRVFNRQVGPTSFFPGEIGPWPLVPGNYGTYRIWKPAFFLFLALSLPAQHAQKYPRLSAEA